MREVEQLRLQAEAAAGPTDLENAPGPGAGADPTNQQKFLTIDKGSKNGVEVGMAVVAQGPNYIGQVTEVWRSRPA